MNNLNRLHQNFCEHSIVFKGNTKKTIQWYEETLTSFLAFSQNEDLSALTKLNLQSWITNGKLHKKWAESTIKGRLQAMSLFCKWLVENELLKENPVADIPRPRLPKKLPKHLTKAEAEKLWLWVENFKYAYEFERTRAKAIMALFLYAGLRQQEVVNLTLASLDLENRVLVVANGKGKKDRVIPMAYNLCCVLEKYLMERDRAGRLCPYLITGLRDDDKVSIKSIRRLVLKLREVSGIYFYPHLLRHTFATLMIEGGCDIYSLSKMMGHSNITTTTIYLSATVDHLRTEIIKHPMNRISS